MKESIGIAHRLPRFTNTVKAEWVSNLARKMLILEDIAFIDESHLIWQAEEGSIVDGASIPRFFWRFIGSPFIGKYRRASVIHDVYCVKQVYSSKQTHKMFYKAMICDGVPYAKAKVMYWAVKYFGPKW